MLSNSGYGSDPSWCLRTLAGRHILTSSCTENNCLPNRLFRNMEVAETFGFMAAVYEGFSEPHDLRMVDQGFCGLVIIEKGGVWRGHPGDCRIDVYDRSWVGRFA